MSIVTAPSVTHAAPTDSRRRSFAGLTIARMGARPYGVVQGTFVALLVASRVQGAFAITFALTAHRYVTALVFPIVGRASDRTASNAGRRVPYMVGGLAVMASGMWLMSAVPGYWAVVGTLVLVRVAAVFYSVGRVTVTPDVFGRSRWILAVIGVFVAGILPSLLTIAIIRASWHQSDPSSWKLTFRLAAGGLALAAVAVGLLVREAPGSRVAAEEAAHQSWQAELRALTSLPNARVFVTVAALLIASGAATSRLLPVWATTVLHAGGNNLASASVIIGLGSVAVVPIGLWLSRRGHPRDLAILAAVVGVLVVAGNAMIDKLVFFEVLSVLGIPVTVAAVVALIPLLLKLVPRADNVGEAYGFLAGPVAFVSVIAAYLSAVIVDLVDNYRVMWLIAAGFLAAVAVVLTRLKVPEGMERTDYRELLRGLREKRAPGLSPIQRLFGGTVDEADVVAGEVF